jgi:cyclic pyranopterin phosphate synthase
MPEDEYRWLPREDVLTFDELSRLVDIFSSLGVEKVRLTGGEPLLRKGLAELVRLISSKPAIHEVALTTNGILLAPLASALRDSGLDRITVSLDSLRPGRFEEMTRRSGHEKVIEGLRSLSAAGFANSKIDSVVVRGVNDDELVELVEFSRTIPAEVRFIEYMDVGGATGWAHDLVVSQDEILAILSKSFDDLEPVPREDSAPATRYALPDGWTFGIVSSTTHPFCANCDRSRITADGVWYQCLYAPKGIDLRQPLRSGASDHEMRQIVTQAWLIRRDAGALERLAMTRREAIPVTILRRDPHLEMHTRGG